MSNYIEIVISPLKTSSHIKTRASLYFYFPVENIPLEKILLFNRRQNTKIGITEQYALNNCYPNPFHIEFHEYLQDSAVQLYRNAHIILFFKRGLVVYIVDFAKMSVCFPHKYK